ncbi:MAG: RNA pseudouridine synthase [Candidatus Dactylopiibacterium carminicum]|uniref:Dual-specificity RNA pseudouridine synthase RluA n=1 Tax=Candidatus Dactylopiibacterium carminicum TaxID=857335 RepID=A0A272ESA9_9RHOO|nr:pseudouridine synthase [Candidatus Dactylopiibacterium carminicum]KAF7598761.1 RNA pseudouridine synthase [Candidatus Dactylopiibacterium carminicum]PAS92600.1 MAG: RNA pseudouridine synthase [Candidatus Dactylopiibacterium carminicum]PAS93897.1 MAG: RNA pseudouridine synthase [Candidatus Dactylopiibacterium carminicum]PAS98784.1 MAG: RNA pseudouridine synthase [Candidatus Dactylopiibacterium carminicum]
MHIPAAPVYTPPADRGLPLLYADAALLICNKPAGLLSVPGRGEAHQDCLLHRIQQRFPDALTVHRLDMETSGLIVLARTPKAQSALSKAFAQRDTQKRYVAVVDGLLADDCGEVDLPLITDWPNRPRQRVDREIGKPSLTYFEVLSRDRLREQTRVRLTPITGRSHQLRVHMLALGHPILGDRLYAPPSALSASSRLLLHAEMLALPHPSTGARMCWRDAAAF